MIENPQHEVLSLKINDKKTDNKLCTMEFNISELLSQDQLSLDKKFNLDCPSSFSASVTIAMSLKVCLLLV